MHAIGLEFGLITNVQNEHVRDFSYLFIRDFRVRTGDWDQPGVRAAVHVDSSRGHQCTIA